jgi:putative ABC transport system substrate-binding protein
MRRRDFITVLGGTLLGGAATWSYSAGAQQPAMPVIGFLSSASPGEYGSVMAAFRRGLGEAGYVEGRNAAIEFRWAEGQFDQLPALAADLVRRQVAVIVAGGSSVPAQAAMAATSTIPIVFSTGSDPISSGLVASFNSPERNVTGVSTFAFEMLGKRLELLRSLAPASGVIGYVANPTQVASAAIQLSALRAAARTIGLQIEVVNATNERELDATFAALAELRVGAAMIAADPFFNSHRAYIVALAARHAIPASYSLRDYVAEGGLMSYGTSITDAYRKTGVYTGRILKGAKPAELPVLLPTKFELVINLKTAKTLGLTVPPMLLALADEVIE